MNNADSVWINLVTGSSWLPMQGIFLLSLRVASVFMFTPIFYGMPMPASVRALLVVALSLTIAAGLNPHSTLALDSGDLIGAALAELALGATLALGILLAFAAVDVAGRLLDIQIGFGIAQVFDPLSQRQVPVLTSAFNQIALVIFFLLNGHHVLLRGIAYSVERFPIGQWWAPAPMGPLVVKQAAALMGLGFSLASPVVFCVLLTELALGVVARNLPQMNMFAIGIPVKIVVGLVALALWFSAAGSVLGRIYQSIYKQWDEIFLTSQGSPDTDRRLEVSVRVD